MKEKENKNNQLRVERAFSWNMQDNIIIKCSRDNNTFHTQHTK